MQRMTLDTKDRLILANQYRILEALYPKEAKSYAQDREAVERGYELDYGLISEHISDETMSEEECREVYDILEMFRRLSYGYELLKDKSGIDAHWVKFRGLDGNNEYRHLGYVRYLVEDQGKHEQVKALPDLDSHAPLLDTYRRMVKMWKPLKGKHPLDKEDIQKIITAGVHPSYL